MKKVIYFVALIIMFSCITQKYVYHGGRYTISLSDVENGIGAKTLSELSYSDSIIEMSWKIGLSNFEFDLTNNASSAIKIIWDEAVYVDTDGTSNRVMHSGVKYSEANSAQPPTVIVGGSRIKDMVLPTKNVYYETNVYMAGWKEKYLLPMTDMDSTRISTIGKLLIGKNIKIMLPLEIDGMKNNYTFIFKIDNFTMVK